MSFIKGILNKKLAVTIDCKAIAINVFKTRLAKIL